MSEVPVLDYHFCTINELQSPKPLPSLDFVSKLVDICHVPMTLFESVERNMYDRKNHILYINNYESYARVLKEKYGRSVLSFEKQLKMMGFKKRKIKQHSNQIVQQTKQEPIFGLDKMSSINKFKSQSEFIEPEDSKKEGNDEERNNNGIFNCSKKNEENKNQNLQPPKYMFVWKTNRMQLIQNQLQRMEMSFEEQLERAYRLKDELYRKRQEIDSKLETIIFRSLLNETEEDATAIELEPSSTSVVEKKRKPSNDSVFEKYIKDALAQVRLLSNEGQIQCKDLIVNISNNMANELQLYRILIYKETHIHKIVEQEE